MRQVIYITLKNVCIYLLLFACSISLSTSVQIRIIFFFLRNGHATGASVVLVVVVGGNGPVSHHAAAIFLHLDGGHVAAFVDNLLSLFLARHQDAGRSGRIREGILLHFEQSTLVGHEGHDEPFGTKGPHHIVNQGTVRRHLLVRLKASIRRTTLGRNVNRRVGTKQDGIHGIPTGLKRPCVNNGTGTERINARFGSLQVRNAFRLLILGFLVFFFFHGRTFRIAMLVRLVVGVIKDLGDRGVNVKHHDIQDTVSVHHVAHSVVSHKDEPMVRGDGTEGVAAPVESFAEVAVSVEIIQLLVKGLVGKGLVPGKVKVFAAVPDPINLQSQLPSQINQSPNATEERRGAARLED